MKYHHRTTLAGLGALLAFSSAAFADPIEVEGVLHAGTPGEVVYRAIAPDAWNGTLVLDLDFNRWAPERIDWFLEQGYAVGGNQRTQNETAYELHDYVDNLLTTKDKLVEAGAAEPDRLVAVGASRGGFVARMAAQYGADAFDGAVALAGGGGGLIGGWNQKAEAIWALTTLADPDSPLAASGLPDLPEGEAFSPAYGQDAALNALVSELSETTEGKARMVLAAALSQTSGWREGPLPAADDYETQGEQIAGVFAWAHPQFVHKEIEVMAGGPITWNHGVDYAAAIDASGMKPLVEYWYDKAGLDLDADIAALDAAPRYSADPDAVATAETIGTYDGTGSPVFAVKTIGDGADSTGLDDSYTKLFAAVGNADNLRTAFIERPGHSTQSELEFRVSFEVLMERLDTGAWPDTSPEALNARADAIADGAEDLGGSLFIDFTPTPALRTWDVRDHGSYTPAE